MLERLGRLRSTSTQAGLSNRSRRQNVTRRFASRERAAGKRILLIDDVMTTGATARGLRAWPSNRRAPERVALLTVARVDRRMDGSRLGGGSRFDVGGKI